MVYELTIANKSNEAFYDLEVRDPMSGNADSIVCKGENLEPGELLTYQYSYTIKAGDVPFGSCTNIAKLFWWDDGERVSKFSNAVTIQVIGDPDPEVDIVATKKEYSASADSAGYAVGEQVVFEVRFENHSDLAICFEAYDWTEESIVNPLG